MKIQSISDIITNSSSEVFIQYDTKAVNQFKKMVDNILSFAGSDLKINDCIEIVPDIDKDEKEDIVYSYKEYEDTENNPTKEQLFKYMWEVTDECFECEDWSPGCITKLKAVPKKPEYNELAKSVTKLLNTFKTKELSN